MSATALAALRRFARGATAERCEACGAALDPRHEHLLDPERRELRCVCEACALLGSAPVGTRWRRIRPRAQALPAFRLTDSGWDSLEIPIGLAYLVPVETAGRVAAFYPSPAGLTESRPAPAAWSAIVADNPVLTELEPHVEALLVHRLGGAREHYRVSVDACYHLAGLLRLRWQGLAGGDEVAGAVRRFLDGLTEAPARA